MARPEILACNLTPDPKRDAPTTLAGVRAGRNPAGDAPATFAPMKLSLQSAAEFPIHLENLTYPQLQYIPTETNHTDLFFRSNLKLKKMD